MPSSPLKCFMENIKGSLKSPRSDDSKLWLQNQLLSKILNQRDLKTYNSHAVKEWLQDQRVLIILDDVDDLEQLDVLAKELSWFGSGSRIIVTTEDKKILKAHGIQDIYHVDFPSKKEALEILCLSAFKQSYVKDGFEELAHKVAEFCGNLPLGLRVVGSSLRGESKYEWECQLSRIKASLDKNIEDILKVGYDRLSKKNQSLFLHIACFFNNEVEDYLKSVLSDSNLDVGNGLKTLADKSLVHISTNGRIVMHHLLQQLGHQVVLGQSDEPGKRQFLIEAKVIRDVLIDETGTGSVIGISFDTSNIGEVYVSKGAFDGMRNLRFLRIYGIYSTLQIPKDMNYLPHLRLLHWEKYPRKALPPRFNPEHLVEIDMQFSNLEKLWGGIQPLPNLKSIDLSCSDRLREIPNLSKATNLETLKLSDCSSLVELPSSISNLHKLIELDMMFCEKLRVIPTNINLASLEKVQMSNCSQLRSFPDLSRNIKTLDVGDTKIKDVPPSVGCWSRLECLGISSKSLKRLTHAPQSITRLDLSNSGIKMIPDCVIRLPHLVDLNVKNCAKLVTIPALSPSLESLNASECVSLKRVCFSFQNSTKKLLFYNCLKLDEEARRGIIQQRVGEYICWLPGKKIPAEFTHKATWKSITIPLAPGTWKSITIPLAPGTFSASSRFKACFLILPFKGYLHHPISCTLRSKGGVTVHSSNALFLSAPSLRSEHLFIFHGDSFSRQSRCHEVDVTMSEIIFEFGYWDKDEQIIECGVQIMTNEAEGSSNSKVDNFETESSSIEVDYYGAGGNNNHHTDGDGDEDYEAEGLKFSQVENMKTSKHIGCWSWIRRLWSEGEEDE